MAKHKISSKISFSLFLVLSSLIIFAILSLSAEAELPGRGLPQTGFQSFQIKKPAPSFSNKRNFQRKRLKIKREKMKRESFSAMLPKGYVPPSGSSPCHNVYPNSVSFFCDYSNQMQKP